jgi:peptidoglycan hydrolase CwlO-like protein
MQLSRRLIAIASGASVILLTACPDDATRHNQAAIVAVTASQPVPEDPVVVEQRRLAGELASLEKQKESLAQSFSDQKAESARSESALRDLKRDLERQKARTDKYIDEHQLQVGCAFADQIAGGEGEYSEKTRDCAKVVSIYCAFAMISGAFRREVEAAKRYVDEAEARAQSLKTQIEAREKELETQRAKLRATQDEIDRTTFEIASVREKMGTNGEDGLQLDIPRSPGASDLERPRSF